MHFQSNYIKEKKGQHAAISDVEKKLQRLKKYAHVF